MAFLIGLVLVALLGTAHHFGLIGVRALIPEPQQERHLAILGAFWGLLLLHAAEILGFALAYRILLAWDWMGSLGQYDGTWEGLVYFSGINYATLGYTQIDSEGPIRMVNMMQSLGGFMVLTWSATFIYSYWQKCWGR